MSEFTEIGPNRLRRNSLGLVAVTFMVISAAAPLTGVAGAMPLAFLLGNGTGIPLTFILLTLIMLAFAAGYVAMSRHVINAGAFYAYAARGLGGSCGGGWSVGRMAEWLKSLARGANLGRYRKATRGRRNRARPAPGSQTPSTSLHHGCSTVNKRDVPRGMAWQVMSKV